MATPNRLLVIVIASSVFLGFITGEMPGVGIGNPFSAADEQAAANLTEEQRSDWTATFGAAGACLVGGAIGLAFTLGTVGAGIAVGLGLAGLGCGVGGITFSVTNDLLGGDNPLEDVPLVGPISQFFIYVLSYMVWLAVVMRGGFTLEGTPQWARILVGGTISASLAWYWVVLARGARA